MKGGFNLSRWALEHIPLTRYLMAVLLIGGMLSYASLGQDEDPPFTFRAMVLQAYWPGATALQMAEQVTDKLEKKLQETPYINEITSYSKPGETLILLELRESAPPKETAAAWYQVRKKIGDIKGTLPAGVVGPFFNDEFGDTFGNIYALTGKGFDYALMRDYADRIQLQLQRVDDVGKVDLLGLQDEKVWIQLSNTKLATLGVSMQQVQQALAQQNAIAPASWFETPTDRVQLRVSGQFTSV
ncbi:MAG: efflux RND transporter permease subunit, partial [Janthinobacterium sp.]